MSPTDIDPKFAQKVRLTPFGCWEWMGCRMGNGYGRLTRNGKGELVHRYAWVKASGRPIPRGLQIDHLCRNKACANPGHLEPVTASENLRRRHPSAHEPLASFQRDKTHCPRGHEYTEENIEWTRKGYRLCKTCRRARWRERYYRKKHRGDG